MLSGREKERQRKGFTGNLAVENTKMPSNPQHHLLIVYRPALSRFRQPIFKVLAAA